MTQTTQSLSDHDVIFELTPKLQTIERLVDSTLQSRIERCSNQVDASKLEELKIEFELEIAMIRMNLEHPMTRYSRQLEAARQNGQAGNSASLTLDAHEAVAVESARSLYRRTQELAT